jgi:NAD(P)-dependent dehydrogenase (short-subunit alcohol dehydrogenase family)
VAISGETQAEESRRRRVLVTGAGLGIGQGIAIELARAGYDVAVHFSSSREGADQTVAECQALGARAIAIGGNLRDVSTCFRVVEEAADFLGGLDALVNNAGVTRAIGFFETNQNLFDEQFEINIRSHFFCAQRAARFMDEQGGGAILNISSVHGGAGMPNHVAYAATKGAIIAFTRTLAIELAPRRIRVNCIAPGLIEVPRYFDMPGYTRDFGGSMVPWGRVGLPDDIGKPAVFFLSEGAEFITGQTLYVDGGTNARMGIEWKQGD